jgi:putative spermidine/putrescine transport system ATP-binding protein
MSDRIVVMREGEIEQIGSPTEVYNRPRTKFVASFVGAFNHLRARVVDAQRGEVEIDGRKAFTQSKLNGAKSGDLLAMALRPETLRPTEASSGPNVLSGIVEDAAFHGAVIRVKLRLNESALLVDIFNPGEGAPERGEALNVTFRPKDLIALEGD